MCFAICEVKFKNDNERTLKRMDSSDQLAKELVQLERMGTVESVTVFHNHHTHRLTETWVDELYTAPALPAQEKSA